MVPAETVSVPVVEPLPSMDAVEALIVTLDVSKPVRFIRPELVMAVGPV